MMKDSRERELMDFKQELENQGYGEISDRMAEALLSLRNYLNGNDTVH